MLSGNGRHRRPRQAPALFVAAGVTGSAVALPLLAASGAHAADSSTWDRVAMCESGGMWSADLGNGLHGGLQFQADTWEQYGGTRYAPTADLASRSQQIAVAERVLAAEGPQAWSTCADVSGLSGGAAAAPVPERTAPAEEALKKGKRQVESVKEADGAAEAPGAESTGDPERTESPESPESTPEAAESARPSGTQAPAEEEAERPVTGETSASASAADGVIEETAGSAAGGKHRGKQAEETAGAAEAGQPVAEEAAEAVRPGQDGADAEREGADEHVSRGDDAVRDAAGAESGYTVRAGDSLWSLAQSHEVPGGWSALYESNKGSLGIDPDLILPGQSLDLSEK